MRTLILQYRRKYGVFMILSAIKPEIALKKGIQYRKEYGILFLII